MGNTLHLHSGIMYTRWAK